MEQICNIWLQIKAVAHDSSLEIATNYNLI